MESSFSHLPLAEQLSELETLYAEYLMGDVDAGILSRLWQEIKELRRQLGIYSEE